MDYGDAVAVKYFDHCATTEIEDATPLVSCAVGFFVKRSTFSSDLVETDYIVLAGDSDVKNRKLHHPYTVILTNDIIEITKVLITDEEEETKKR